MIPDAFKLQVNFMIWAASGMSLVLLAVQAGLLLFIVAISTVKAMCNTAPASQS